MIFAYTKFWEVLVKTQVGLTKLRVDSGAAASCLSITDLASLLDKSIDELVPYVKRQPEVTLHSINNTALPLHALTLPKISVGQTIFPTFYCFVSLDTKFVSVLGLDILRHGITHLYYKGKGDCDSFDFVGYEREHSHLPYGKLAFLDYSESEK